jgi:hypothetical protein
MISITAYIHGPFKGARMEWRFPTKLVVFPRSGITRMTHKRNSSDDEAKLEEEIRRYKHSHCDWNIIAMV